VQAEKRKKKKNSLRCDDHLIETMITGCDKKKRLGGMDGWIIEVFSGAKGWVDGPAAD
jgi:hypothetical protein